MENLLLKEAMKSEMNKKYACFIFDSKNNIIGLGHNDYDHKKINGIGRSCFL